MTVKELINKLEEMPQDLEVYDFSHEKVYGCHVQKEFCAGDPANPKCPIITIVMID